MREKKVEDTQMNLRLKDRKYESVDKLILPYGTIRRLVEKVDDADLGEVLTQALPEIRQVMMLNFPTLTDRDLRRMTLSAYAQAVLDFMTECMGIFTTELTDMRKDRQLELTEFEDDFRTVRCTHTAKLCEMTEGLLEDVTELADAYQNYEKNGHSHFSIQQMRQILEDVEDMLTDTFETLDCYGMDNTNIIDILRVCITAFSYGSGLMARVPDATPKNA